MALASYRLLPHKRRQASDQTPYLIALRSPSEAHLRNGNHLTSDQFYYVRRSVPKGMNALARLLTLTTVLLLIAAVPSIEDDSSGKHSQASQVRLPQQHGRSCLHNFLKLLRSGSHLQRPSGLSRHKQSIRWRVQRRGEPRPTDEPRLGRSGQPARFERNPYHQRRHRLVR